MSRMKTCPDCGMVQILPDAVRCNACERNKKMLESPYETPAILADIQNGGTGQIPEIKDRLHRV